MKKRVVITSLHFSPGFVGHMQAWYKMCEQCDIEPILLLSDGYGDFFCDGEYKYVTDIKTLNIFKPNFAVVQNTGFENIEFFKWCEKNNCKILFILHEPFMGIKELVKDGPYCLKQAGACILNMWLCKKADRVIICSNYAQANFNKYMKKFNRKMVRFPLIFLDEYKADQDERKYFSLIGTYAVSKGSDVFVEFVKYATNKGYNISFQIATRSNINKQLNDPVLRKLMKEGMLIVQSGRDMSPDEINMAYRRSICCWNGYRRSTQSGVLPNAFMMGTPVLATNIGSFREFVEPGITGEFIDIKDFDSIYKGYQRLCKENKSISKRCRMKFLEQFWFGNQCEKFVEILNTMI